MKEWYYVITLSDGTTLRNECVFQEGIDGVIKWTINDILYWADFTGDERFTVSIFDYPPNTGGGFGQATHILELNIIR